MRLRRTTATVREKFPENADIACALMVKLSTGFEMEFDMTAMMADGEAALCVRAAPGAKESSP